VLVIDYGAQYAQLIARRVREANIYSEIVPHTASTEAILAKNPSAIILSGGPSSVYADGAPQVGADLFKSGVPTLGICYGFQAMARALGGTVSKTGRREYGSTGVASTGETSCLFDGVPSEQVTWMSHGDSVTEAPEGFKVLASSDGAPVAAFADDAAQLYGVQWHPEVNHSEFGQAVLENFLYRGAGLEPTWTAGNIVEDQVARIRAQVGSKRAICALSGGVDSAVAAALVQRAIGDQLTCVYVDHGLMRQDESSEIEKAFGTAHGGAVLKVIDASEVFLSKLAGVTDPETKRKIIGEQFIRTFERAQADIIAESAGEDVAFLVQRARRTSRATTTWAACRMTSSSNSWSRCARCSRTRSVRWVPNSACRMRSCTASPSPAPASASASSARSHATDSTCCAARTRSRVRN
jgi:GMP synthase (glutamine-hydrolysing)